MTTFFAVVILPDGFSAEESEVRDALQASLDEHADGARVAVREVDGVRRWSDALLEVNAELGNLAP